MKEIIALSVNALKCGSEEPSEDASDETWMQGLLNTGTVSMVGPFPWAADTP
jgi:hypothetical protein